MKSPTAQYFTLQNAFGGRVMSASVSNLGAAIIGLKMDDRVIIPEPDAASILSSFSGSTLAPWPNRLAAGTWQHQGQQLNFAINEPARDNALHGLVFDRLFDVVEHTTSRIELSINLKDVSGYPFEIQVLVSYELTDQGLVGSLGAKNLGSNPAPVALATHPYFTVPASQGLRLVSSAKTMAAVNENMIPIGTEPSSMLPGASLGELASAGLDADLLDLDHCFFDQQVEADGLIHNRIRSGADDFLDVWQEPVFKYTMIYTTHIYQSSQGPIRAFAIEPQTAPADALKTGEDLIWLEPGQSWSASWGVKI